MSTIQNANTLLTSMSTTNLGGKRVISHAANQSVRPYNTNQDYLYAMREDLSEWLKGLYAVEIDVTNFFQVLETGILLCRHANNITTCAEYIQKNNIKVPWKSALKFPTKMITFNQGRYVRASSFFARDNVANFIDWCRNELEISDAVMFETNDLVLRRNEKHVILCLLEVARRGSKFGVPAPVLIQMEEEIDEEIEMEKAAKEYNKVPPRPAKQKVNCDFKSLDEMVRYILGMCTCPSQFPMTRVSDGKYKVGDSENLIFMRILRQHVMVRVGGGWDTLEHYLNKHDPCRCQKHKTDRAFTPRNSRSQSTATSPRQQPQRQYQRSLTSSGASLRSAPPTSARLAASGRMSRSTTNLTELMPYGKSGKVPPKQRRSSSQSRNSSITSDASSSDKRPLTSRHSHDVERNVARNSQNKKNRLSLQSDVFDRLSRPKSTPPITRTTSVHQDDRLLVQRNKKGSHQVQRTSTPRTSRGEKGKPLTRSSDNSDLRSKSSVILSTSKRNEEPLSRTMEPRQRRSLQTTQNQSSRPSTARNSRPRSRSATRETVVNERDLLQAFEKESFGNKHSVQHNVSKSPPRQASVDSSLDSHRLLSHTSSEDSEVALHMQAANEPKPSRPPPSSYNSFSLPRPRKEKREQYDKRTRIPTPVSFNKTLPTSRSLDFYQEKMPLENSSRPIVVSDEVIQQIAKAEQKKHLMNGHGQINGGPPSPLDIRQPRTAIPFDKINLLLNSGKFSFENDAKPNGYSAPEIRVSQHLDSTSLHSSGHAGNGERQSSKSAFVPMENRPKKDLQRQFAIFDEVFSSARPHHDINNQPVKAWGPGAPVNGEIKQHRAASDPNADSPLPSHLLKTPINNSREPQWV